MDKISERLLGSFNIEMVVQPIDLKISEAIMNFQENGADITQRVFAGCGRPILGRRRRMVNLKDILDQKEGRLKSSSSDDIEFEGSEQIEHEAVRNTRATNRELTYESYKFNKNSAEINPGSNKRNKNGKQNTSSLEKLIKDIRHIVKESKRFWNYLPYQICNNEELAERPSKEDNCWNGTSVGKYV